MFDAETIRYFVRFEANAGYSLSIKQPDTLGELKKLIELSGFQLASQLLFVDEVKTNPEVAIDVQRFYRLVAELLSSGLEHCAYFHRSFQGDSYRVSLVLRVKCGSLNRYIAQKTLPFVVHDTTLIDLINSVDQLTELLKVD